MTTPPLVTPSMFVHATRVSGICSVISASHSWSNPPQKRALKCTWVSSIWVTDFTGGMKLQTRFSRPTSTDDVKKALDSGARTVDVEIDVTRGEGLGRGYGLRPSLTEPPARPRDGEPLHVEQVLDPQQLLHVPPGVDPLPLTRFLRTYRPKLVLPVPEHVRLDPDDPGTYHNRGIAYKQLGMFDEAIADFTYVLHLDPNYAEAYFNRHLTYLQRGAPGDDRLARRDMDRYRRLLQRRPTDNSKSPSSE